ncbi:MAG TPA: hypothetical protein VHH88_13260 [Verrucomicrobiae bacterium]|nr:hypothetical protein [Verrucomicrobiae bacterium]
MSEFKFACPVCGQHITADSSASGGQLECPTCYRKIVIPQAPQSGEQSKLILSAAQVSQPRPAGEGLPGEGTGVRPAHGRGSTFATIGFFAVLGAAVAAVVVFRGKIFKGSGADSQSVSTKAAAAPVTYAVPTNIQWSLGTSNIDIPDQPAAGRIHGAGFFAEHASVQGGNLTLRQGKSGPPDLAITLELFARQTTDLSGKTVEISPDREPPLPKIVLRWKDEQQKPRSQTITSGYLLRISFGQAANGRIPGRLYLAAPDGAKSFVAGNFEAQIRKPKPARRKAPAKKRA